MRRCGSFIDLVSAAVGIGFLGIVIGLAAQAVLSNVFSGLMLVPSSKAHNGFNSKLVGLKRANIALGESNLKSSKAI